MSKFLQIKRKTKVLRKSVNYGVIKDKIKGYDRGDVIQARTSVHIKGAKRRQVKCFIMDTYNNHVGYFPII